MAPANPVTETTRRRIEERSAGLPFGDRQDFDDADAGLRRPGGRSARSPPPTAASCGTSTPTRSCAAQRRPTRANPSLWRQGQLLIEDGLFEVVPGIYQLRGFDLSVMSVIEGDTGVIVIDPLISKETAAAAFALYTEHRGERPVTAMIYTHSHVDHFGGVKGIITEEQVAAGEVAGDRPRGLPAPRDRRERLRRHRDAAAGRLHVRRRARARARPARSAPGSGRPPRPAQVDPHRADGRHHRTPASAHARRRGARVPGDAGHRGAGGDELLLPASTGRCAPPRTPRTRCTTSSRIRGALVRDAHAWAHYLTETIDLWGDELDVVFALAPLADLGPRAGRRVPGHAARHVPLPARPDPADAQPGLHRRRDRRDAARCRRRSRRSGTPTATTARSATT